MVYVLFYFPFVNCALYLLVDSKPKTKPKQNKMERERMKRKERRQKEKKEKGMEEKERTSVVFCFIVIF